MNVEAKVDRLSLEEIKQTIAPLSHFINMDIITPVIYSDKDKIYWKIRDYYYNGKSPYRFFDSELKAYRFLLTYLILDKLIKPEELPEKEEDDININDSSRDYQA